MQTRREVQQEYEMQADTAAAASRLAELQKAAAAGDVEVPRAARLIARVHAVVQESLQDAQNTVTRGIGGKYKAWLRAIPADVAAVIAVRECIQKCTSATHHRPALVQDLASSVGKLWELEVRIREAESVNPVYMRKIHEQVKANCTTSTSHLRRLYNTAYERVMKGEVDTALSKSELIQIGKFGVQACLDAGLLEMHRTVGSKGALVYYTLAEEVHGFLTGYTHSDVRLVTDKAAGAMLCPPEDWSTLGDGGYLTQRRKIAFPLLNLQSVRNELRSSIMQTFTAENMPDVFECANYLQSIPFAVHVPTAEAIRKVWEAGGGVLGVPDKNAPVRPEFPFADDWDRKGATERELEQFSAWKRSAVAYHEHLRTWRGKVREVGGFLKSIAAGEDTLWFPVYCDRRGRWYYRGSPNPQGSDLAKGVLHFKEKKPLGKDGLFWLKVLVANAYGFDKDRFAERARWTEQNWSTIERALDAPEDFPDVWGTDAPWCMFSAAWELREALSCPNPQEYMTGQIAHMDATCSGLQHFSAILRDPVGGACVNLVDEVGCGPKQDIYAKVAANALQAITRDLDSDDPEVRAMAAWWGSTGIPRALAKKPVMTYVYGATLQGTARHIESVVNTDMPDVHWPDSSQSFRYSQYAARKLFHGIAATVPAAENAMHWLRSIAKQHPRGKGMQWRMPTGFVVLHDYRDYDEVRIHIRSCGIGQTIVRNFGDGTNPLQMQNAIAPNFVHALDACHLTMTALAMKNEALSFVGIHDSYGTHLCDVQRMHSCIREEFVRLYEHRNTLGEFLWDINCAGETPTRGSLDLKKVLDSEFFFC